LITRVWRKISAMLAPLRWARAMWRAGIDHETYVLVDGVWMFRHKRSELLMNVPFETGWAETRLT
jgi:hypothetical protein